ncbi:hypothetical protein ScPMuIL_005889 [Solemya velum]
MADELFSKRLQVLFKSPDREDRKVYISLRLEVQTVVSPVHRKELVVRLTDEKDLLFLYTLRLGEEDFQSLKSQQGLLVDFGAFPQKFIDLLEMCLKEENRESPKFVLHFLSQASSSGDRSMSILNVIETNPFKHLTHLSLKFIPGTDTDVKKHLANCLKQLKETNGMLQQRLEYTDMDLNKKLKKTEEELTCKTIELDNLRADWTSKMNEMTARHKQELTAEKERAVQMQAGYHQQQERDRREKEQAHMKTVQQMEARLYELEGNNKELTDRKYKSESTIREMKSKLASLEEEHARAKQELQSLRKQNSSLDAEYHEQEKNLNHLRTRAAVMEQEIKDKEQVLARSTDLLGSEQDKKRKTEEDLDQKHREISRLENKVKAMSEELMKGNDIIKKLQGEIKNYHAKIKLRNQIATEQEKLLSEKDQELEKLRQDLAVTKETLKVKEDENRKLSSDLEISLQKLDESRQLLKTNENVIQWLNKQINETQITQTRVGTFEKPNSASFRPTSTMQHNYSTSSYGSGGSNQLQESHMANSGVAIPRSYPNPHRPQVQYNPGLPRKTGLPVSNRAGPPPSIPEEIRPNSSQSSQASSHSAGDKENDPPLDPKFLQKREDAIPVRGLISHSVPVSAQPSSLNTHPPQTTRLSQHLIVPNSSNHLLRQHISPDTNRDI